jgi:hypothetical protein
MRVFLLPSILFRDPYMVFSSSNQSSIRQNAWWRSWVRPLRVRAGSTSCASRAFSRRSVENLCAQAGESAGVGDVGASGTATATTGTGIATSLTTATAATTLAASATELATATTLAGATAATATALAATSTGTTLTGRGSEHAVTVELDVNLLLALALTLGLAGRAGHEVLLGTGNGGTLGELLAAALVGLAEALLTELQLLLSKLSKVGDVGLGVVLGLGLSSLGLGVLLDGLLLLSLGDGLASLLVSELGVAVVTAPAVSSLLVAVAGSC